MSRMRSSEEPSAMFEGQSIRVTLKGGDIAELCFDRRNAPVNKLDSPAVEELRAATEAIRKARGVRGVLVTSAKDVFIVGADIYEFPALLRQPEAHIREHIGSQSAVFTAFEDLD